MPDRVLQIIKPGYPLTGMCELCRQVFLSRSENPDQAERDINKQFDSHRCETNDPA
jgi:hypothetical protein